MTVIFPSAQLFWFEWIFRFSWKHNLLLQASHRFSYHSFDLATAPFPLKSFSSSKHRKKYSFLNITGDHGVFVFDWIKELHIWNQIHLKFTAFFLQHVYCLLSPDFKLIPSLCVVYFYFFGNLCNTCLAIILLSQLLILNVLFFFRKVSGCYLQ